jgi:hypothetical protein
MLVSGNETAAACEHGSHCLIVEGFTITNVELVNILMRQ